MKTISRAENSGFTVIELLVILTVLGIAVAAASLFLKPAAAPLQSATVLTEGYLRQIRARAMSTTSAYRLTPIDATRLGAAFGQRDPVLFTFEVVPVRGERQVPQAEHQHAHHPHVDHVAQVKATQDRHGRQRQHQRYEEIDGARAGARRGSSDVVVGGVHRRFVRLSSGSGLRETLCSR